MTSCPSDQQLHWLLDEQLDRADEDRIVVHVETCSRCQERLDDLVRNRLPNTAWLLSPPAEIAAQSRPAPRSSQLEDSPGASDAADSPPATPPDVTVDLAGVDQLPTSSIRRPPSGPPRLFCRPTSTSPPPDLAPTPGPSDRRFPRHDRLIPHPMGPIRADAIDAANGHD
jgi:hypothetical protein